MTFFWFKDTLVINRIIHADHTLLFISVLGIARLPRALSRGSDPIPVFLMCVSVHGLRLNVCCTV